MANKRMITSETWEDDFFTSLSMVERLIWIGIITACADDQGRLQDNANLVNSKLFPMDDNDKAVTEKALNKFVKAGRLFRYAINGKKLLQVTNWWKHQTPRWAGASHYPPPEGWADRTRYHSTGRKIVETNWNNPGGFESGYIVTSTCDDVNDDINVNDDGNDDVDVEDGKRGNDDNNSINDIPNTSYKPLEVAFVKATGLTIPVGGGTPTRKWVLAFGEMLAEGVEPQDITQACEEMAANDYKIVGPSSIRNGVRIVRAKRNGKSKGSNPEATPERRKSYTEGEYGQYIEH